MSKVSLHLFPLLLSSLSQEGHVSQSQQVTGGFTKTLTASLDKLPLTSPTHYHPPMTMTICDHAPRTQTRTQTDSSDTEDMGNTEESSGVSEYSDDKEDNDC